MEQDKKEDKCKHPAEKARYLHTHITPNVFRPTLMSVACCIFLCEECGELFTSHIEVSRGYLGDGTIAPEMVAEIEKIQMQKTVDAKVKSELERRESEQRAKQRAEDLQRAAAENRSRAAEVGGPGDRTIEGASIEQGGRIEPVKTGEFAQSTSGGSEPGRADKSEQLAGISG